MSKNLKQVLASYARAALAAVITLAATGNMSPHDLAMAALAAIAPPLLRWLNPNDTLGQNAN
jgi:hypothetical protein